MFGHASLNVMLYIYEGQVLNLALKTSCYDGSSFGFL